MSNRTIITTADISAINDALSFLHDDALSGSEASRAIMRRVGFVTLANIKKAYIDKARGGTDEAGDRWKPLKPSTIARRGKRGRGSGSGKGGSPSREAGGRQHEILRDTGVLFNSLSFGATGNVLDTNVPSQVVVGTNVPYASFHHKGTSRIPQRRLWPEPKRWPAHWWEDIQYEVREGLIDMVAESLRNIK